MKVEGHELAVTENESEMIWLQSGPFCMGGLKNAQ